MRGGATSIKATSRWMASSRFKHIHRPYDASTVAKFTPRYLQKGLSHTLSGKLYDTLKKHQANKTASVTFGVLDPIQAVAMAPHCDTIYVSGWQTASTASSTREVGPDFADYPSDSVPLKVDQIMRALDFHDTKYRLMGEKQDYLRPIIADADAGFGGVSSVMKLTKSFVEAGVAGIHLEDQRQGAKRCGHLGSKVLVPIREHIERLISARLQADILRCPLVLVSRTDAESAVSLDNNIDSRDVPFLVGTCRLGVKPSQQGWRYRSISPTAGTLRTPLRLANCTLEEAYHEATKRKGSYIDRHNAMEFMWEPNRSPEGFYSIRSGIDYCIKRSLAYAPYSDMLWMETSTPNYEQARKFANAIHSEFPDMMLAYNLSPSFNWDKSGMTDQQIRDYSAELAKLGFNWQFITLAGFHVNGLATTLFARKYRKDRMLTYVRDIQRREREEKVDLLKHQTWSGVDVADALLSVVTSGKGSTVANVTSIEKMFK